MPKVGVLLAGRCVYDGSEIREAVLALDVAGPEVVCIAPDRDQLHVIDHRSGREQDERRNVLVESARIARGEITEVADVAAADLDALVIPGGFGAAKNLSDFAVSGAEASVQPEVQRRTCSLGACPRSPRAPSASSPRCCGWRPSRSLPSRDQAKTRPASSRARP